MQYHLIFPISTVRYADRAHAYWTGYFTSRPALKGYVRLLSSYYVVSISQEPLSIILQFYSIYWLQVFIDKIIFFKFRQLDSQSLLKEEVVLALQQTVWLMLQQLFNIMMPLQEQKNNMLQMIMPSVWQLVMQRCCFFQGITIPSFCHTSITIQLNSYLYIFCRLQRWLNPHLLA